MREEILKRARKVIMILGVSGILLLLYSIFVIKTGLGIPCIINLTTGYNCPACGITRFCAAALRFDFSQAIRYNYFSPVILGIFIWIGGYTVVDYIKNGKVKLDPKPVWCQYVVLVLVIGWWVIRNIIGI